LLVEVDKLFLKILGTFKGPGITKFEGKLRGFCYQILRLLTKLQ
jgi:hypothetical protein